MFSKLIRLAIISSVLYAAVAAPVQAIPAFAKAYNMTCASCHAYYPRLNDFGERFRRNGYQLPDGKKLVTVGSQRMLPASVEVTSQTTASGLHHETSTTANVISGGAISRGTSFFAQYPTYTTASESYNDQPDRLQQGNIQLTDFAHTGLFIKAGRFIPSFYAFGPDRHLVVSTRSANLVRPAGYWDGVEISEFGAGGMSYCVGHADWVKEDAAAYPLKGTYARIAKSFGGGIGETKGHCVGLSAFTGSTATDWFMPWYPFGGPVRLEQDVKQIGADASLNFGRANLSLQYTDGAFEASGPQPREDFHGTVAQLAYSASERCVVAAGFIGYRYEIDSRMASIGADLYFVSARYYVSHNLALSASYGWLSAVGSLFTTDSSPHSSSLGLDLSY